MPINMKNVKDDLEIKCIALMERLVNSSVDDSETSHIEADRLLTQLLDWLGFQRLVELYNQVHKWYS